MKRVPIYNVRTWRIRAADSQRIVLRPTLRTFAIRLQATIVFLAMIGVIEYTVRRMRSDPAAPPGITQNEHDEIARGAEDLREFMRVELGEETAERIEREAAQSSAAREAEIAASARRVEQVGDWVRFGRYTLYGVLAAVGLLPPLGCLWSRVTIRRTVRGEVSVRAFEILLRRRTWPGGHFERIRTFAMERYWNGRYGRITRHAWDWFVQLDPAGLAHMPVAMDVAWAGPGKDLPPQFLVHRQKYQPGTKDCAPEPVREFVKALRALTGLPADQPQIIEARLHRGFFGTRVSRRMPISQEIPISHESHTYNSIDKMPEEVREKFRELLESGEVRPRDDGSIEVVKHFTTAVDVPQGQLGPKELAALPPEIRDRVEDLLRDPKKPR